jgi:hypothetical protein
MHDSGRVSRDWFQNFHFVTSTGRFRSSAGTPRCRQTHAGRRGGGRIVTKNVNIIICIKYQMTISCEVNPWSDSAKRRRRVNCPIHPIYTKFCSLPNRLAKSWGWAYPRFRPRGITHECLQCALWFKNSVRFLAPSAPEGRRRVVLPPPPRGRERKTPGRAGPPGRRLPVVKNQHKRPTAS